VTVFVAALNVSRARKSAAFSLRRVPHTSLSDDATSKQAFLHELTALGMV